MNDMVPISDLQTMAVAIAKSGLFGAKTPDQALALMLVAQAEGLHPASAARDYDIIQGKGAKKSEAMLRDFLKSGGTVKWHALDDSKADATFSHPAGGEVRIVWDMHRADVAGLKGKEMYKKFPRQMLRARCVSEGVRTVCPMATGGMYTPEEVQDIPAGAPQEKDMGAAAVVEQPKAKSEPRPQVEDAEIVATTVTTPPGEGTVTDAKPMLPGQLKILRAKMTNAGLDDAALVAKFGPIENLKFSMFADVQKWTQEAAQ